MYAASEITITQGLEFNSQRDGLRPGNPDNRLVSVLLHHLFAASALHIFCIATLCKPALKSPLKAQLYGARAGLAFLNLSAAMTLMLLHASNCYVSNRPERI